MEGNENAWTFIEIYEIRTCQIASQTSIQPASSQGANQQEAKKPAWNQAKINAANPSARQLNFL